MILILLPSTMHEAATHPSSSTLRDGAPQCERMGTWRSHSHRITIWAPNPGPAAAIAKPVMLLWLKGRYLVGVH